jgi:serine/threonine-protein kinase
MNCYHCETPIPDDSVFCLRCGGVASGPVGYGSAYLLDEAAVHELERLVRQDTAGEYEIQRELGRGGMAVVYLATEIALARQVAIKVLPPSLTFGRGAVERFKREAKVAAALAHANIIPIYRVSAGRLFWYAMKYVEGRTLADILLERKVLPLDQAIRILEQVADALDYAHERRVVHRDVKPANVMVEARGRVVVTDFGIAKEVVEGSLSGSGVVIGTPFYMSAEQSRGELLSGAADQYSTGVMAYHMLAGQVPFDGNTIVDIVHKHCVELPPPLEVLRPGLPQEVYSAIHRAMAKSPLERFPSVGAFVEALKGPANAITLRLAARPSGARVGGWRRWLVAAGIAALALAAVPRATLWRRDRTAPPRATVGPHTTEASAAVPGFDTARRAVRANPSVPTAGRPGSLIIQTVGGWARISIDGVFRHEGTSDREAVTPGSHQIHLDREGYAPVDTMVTLRTRDTLILRLTLRREAP